MIEARKYMDTLIKNEMEDHIYLNPPEFFPAFFDSINGLSRHVDDVFAHCQQVNYYKVTHCWSGFPWSYEEHKIAS
jgi:hypothetical protein